MRYDNLSGALLKDSKNPNIAEVIDAMGQVRSLLASTQRKPVDEVVFSRFKVQTKKLWRYETVGILHFQRRRENVYTA